MKKKIKETLNIFFGKSYSKYVKQSKYIFPRLYVLLIIFTNRRSISKDLQDLGGSFYSLKITCLHKTIFLIPIKIRFDYACNWRSK